MAIQNLADAFHDELRDILSAERQLLKALPKMVQKANSPELKAAIQDHLKQTEKQVARAEAAFEETGKTARAKVCEAMKGLLEEADHILDENAPADVLDAMIIAAAQKVEHYEIATYGTLCVWAETLGYTNAYRLLKETINEEENADKLLSRLSVEINAAAFANAE